MKFQRILISFSLPALLVACGGDQEPAPVEYRTPAPSAAPAPSVAPLVQTGAPDARGIINYPDYAVVQARRGDTIDAMAGRAGVAASELAAYNGLPTNYAPQVGDELVLPPRPGGYAQVAAATTQPLSGPISEPLAPSASTGSVSGEWNPAAIGSVINDEAPGAETTVASPFDQGPAPQSGFDVAGQPVVSHQVAPGETIYTISRQYNVAAEKLIQWNNLVGPSYTVYPGQTLSIPYEGSFAPSPDVAAAPTTQLGGAISPADQTLTTLAPPRSALPADTVAATPLESPQLSQYQSAPPVEEVAAAPAAPVAAAPVGRLSPPVSGAIIRGYNKTSGAARNDGVDFAATEGEDVRAADDGTVALVSRSLGGLGNIILIRHNSEILTVYGRVGEIKVAKGAPVRRGQPIAEVAPARGAEGPTVHFEVRRGAVSVDPEEYL